MTISQLTSLAVHKFLYQWFLAPALTYYREGRVEDATALFLAFVDNEVAALNSGIRLSGVDDVDVTDLPALFDAFCRGPGDESRWTDPCALPFLQAVSMGETGMRSWDPLGAGIPNFLASYRQANGSSPDLISYLDMERRVGDPNSPIESWGPETLPIGANYLGHFAKGRHFAATLGTGTACTERRELALLEFRRASTPSTPQYFVRAIQEATDDLARRPPCVAAR